MSLEITSTANARLKHLISMRRRRIREQTATTLVEGHEELSLAVSAGVRPITVFYCEALVEPRELELLDRVAEQDTEIVRMSRPVFERVAYRESPDGWLAVVPAVPDQLSALDVGPRPFLLVCEGVEKPGNLGAMLRTADAAGVDAVIAADPVTDWGNPNLIRASKGTVFSVPVASAGVDEVLAWLRERSVTVLATTPDTDLLLADVDMTGPVAIAVGTEKYGLSDQFFAAAGVRVRIPMFGRADSLNVATAAAVATYEAVRQRMAAGSLVSRV